MREPAACSCFRRNIELFCLLQVICAAAARPSSRSSSRASMKAFWSVARDPRARWAATPFSRLYGPNACTARCEHPQPDFLHPQPPSTLQGSLEPLERSRSPPESAMTTCPWPALLHPSSSHTSQGNSCRSCRTCPQAKPGTEAFASTTLPASEPLRTPEGHAVGHPWRMFLSVRSHIRPLPEHPPEHDLRQAAIHQPRGPRSSSRAFWNRSEALYT